MASFGQGRDGEAYEVEVRARDESGNESAFTATIEETPVDAPDRATPLRLEVLGSARSRPGHPLLGGGFRK